MDKTDMERKLHEIKRRHMMFRVEEIRQRHMLMRDYVKSLTCSGEQARITKDNARQDSDLDPDDWVTINNAKVNIGDDGEIKAGMGGKYTGQKIGEIGSKPKPKLKRKKGRHVSDNPSYRAAKKEIDEMQRKAYGNKRISGDARAELIREYIEQQTNDYLADKEFNQAEAERANAAYSMLALGRHMSENDRKAQEALRLEMGIGGNNAASRWEREALEAERAENGLSGGIVGALIDFVDDDYDLPF